MEYIVHNVCLVLLSTALLVLAYPLGAPPFACFDLDPALGHASSTATGPAPYQVSFSKSSYRPGETVKVTLSGINGALFKGFIMVGRVANSTVPRAVGLFTVDGEGNSQITCDTDPGGNGVTHTSAKIKDSLTFDWEAPSTNVGDIVFRFAVVRGGAPNTTRNTRDYFSGLRSPLLKAKSDTDGIIERDSRCGQDMGCLSYCVSGSCKWQLMFLPEGDAIRFDFKATAKDKNNYVALGFNSQSAMAIASVLSCQVYDDKIEVKASTNPEYKNVLLTNPSESISNASGSIENGILHCNFLRDKESSNPLIYNLTQPWYLIIALGVTDGGVLQYHNTDRFLTDKKFNMQNTTLDVSFAPLPTTTPVPTTQMPQPGQFQRDGGCGTTKGCFSNCVSGVCDWQVTFAPEGENIRFDLKSSFSAANRYVAVGFSQNAAMNPASVLACVTQNDKQQVTASKNYQYSNTALKNVLLDMASNITTSYEDGILHCNFLMKKISTNPSINNLTRPWYLITARGSVGKDGVLMPHTSTDHFLTNVQVSVDNVTFDVQFPQNRPGPSTTMPKPTNTFAHDPECGRTKGCYSDCDDDQCTNLLSWQKQKDHFQITLKLSITASDNRWVALGFSNQAKMGEASVVECTIHNGKINAYSSFNNGRSNTRLTVPSEGISQVKGDFKDGVLSCTFLRVTSSNNSKIYDLTKKWYLITAHGKVFSNGQKQMHDPKDAFFTTSKLDFSDNSVDISMEEPSYPMIKLHGCLMIGAWILSASIGIAVARFFKPICPDRLICGVKVWFLVHRAAMIITFCLGVAAFIIIFVHVDGYSEIMGEDFKKAHPILGIIVTSLLVINPFMSLLRCKPDHPQRTVFNWAHLTVGTSAHILAAVTIAIGMYLPKAQVDGDKNLYVIIGYGGWQVIFFGIMSILDYLKLTEREENSYNVNDCHTHKPDVHLRSSKSINYDSVNEKAEIFGLDKKPIVVEEDTSGQTQAKQKKHSQVNSIKNFLLVLHIGILIGIAAYLMYTIIETEV